MRNLLLVLILISCAAAGFAADFAETKKKAEAGDAYAQLNLGLMYGYGGDYGVLKDSTEAVKWYRKSAEQGDASAQFILGMSYEKGDGVLKDSVEAHAWYNNASANGNEIAKKNLSNIEKTMSPDQLSAATKLAREIFNRISTNFAAGFTETKKMAEAGDASAQYNLGLMYRHGDGVLKDSFEAVKWYRKSAEQGYALAQLNLGVMYNKGDGVLEDSVEAHAWYNNASANGNEAAKKI